MRLFLSLLVAGCATSTPTKIIHSAPPPALALDEEGMRLQELAEKTSSSYPPQVNPEPEQRYAVPLGDSPARGRDEALITLVEFGDFRCPFTARAQATLAALREKYGDELRIVWKHQPHANHGAGRLMAHAVECARDQGRFWELHDALFAVARVDKDEDAAKEIEPLATKLVPDAAKWQACYRNKAEVARINRDQALSRQLHAIGTPSFFINGRFILGAKPLETFVKLIDEELAKARDLGLSGSEYYGRVLAEGMSPAEADRDLQPSAREVTAEEMAAERVSRPDFDIGLALRHELNKGARDLLYRICVNRYGHVEQVTPYSKLAGGFLITRQIYERWQFRPRAEKVCYREIIHLR